MDGFSRIQGWRAKVFQGAAAPLCMTLRCLTHVVDGVDLLVYGSCMPVVATVPQRGMSQKRMYALLLDGVGVRFVSHFCLLTGKCCTKFNANSDRYESLEESPDLRLHLRHPSSQGPAGLRKIRLKHRYLLLSHFFRDIFQKGNLRRCIFTFRIPLVV